LKIPGVKKLNGLQLGYELSGCLFHLQLIVIHCMVAPPCNLRVPVVASRCCVSQHPACIQAIHFQWAEKVNLHVTWIVKPYKATLTTKQLIETKNGQSVNFNQSSK